MPERTITRFFRISENTFLALEEEAKKHNISLNTLVSQLFLSYANFDRHFQRLGFLKMSKVTFRKIMEVAPDNDLVELAREAAQQSSRVIALAKHGTWLTHDPNAPIIPSQNVHSTSTRQSPKQPPTNQKSQKSPANPKQPHRSPLPGAGQYRSQGTKTQ